MGEGGSQADASHTQPGVGGDGQCDDGCGEDHTVQEIIHMGHLLKDVNPIENL